MKATTGSIAATVVAMSLAFFTAAASAQMPFMAHAMHGPGGGPMMGPVAMLTRQDADSAADMGLVHEMLMSHSQIKRTVTNLSDGIKTTTESDDPYVAQAIKQHVASMSQRLQDGREFNIFSTTLPVLFENAERSGRLSK
jgi:hypothetical protein